MIGNIVSKRLPPAPAAGRSSAPWVGLLVLVAGLFVTPPARAQIDIVEEIDCLALNIYFEARGEPDLGKIAVGHVVLNRVADTRFPETVCAVIQQGGAKSLHRCQFSWWCDGRSDQPLNDRTWHKVRAVAQKVYWGFSQDPTAGALWYHARHVSPAWGKSLTRGPLIGEHVFYVDEDMVQPWPASFTASFTVD